MTRRVDAIDLSHWNTVTSFRDVFESGVVGVIHKCTEGTSYVDPTYKSRMAEALGEGLLWGAYHFLKHGDAMDQMTWFLANADLPVGSRVVIDYEDPQCTLDDLYAAIDAIEEIDATVEIAIYSGHLLKEQVGNANILELGEHSLWLAQYTSGEPSWPDNTWPLWSLWQWTDKGDCPGIKGDCDLNTFNGDREGCALWFGPVQKEIEETAEEIDEVFEKLSETDRGVVKIAIETGGDVSVRVVIDGEEWRPPER